MAKLHNIHQTEVEGFRVIHEAEVERLWSSRQAEVERLCDLHSAEIERKDAFCEAEKVGVLSCMCHILVNCSAFMMSNMS